MNKQALLEKYIASYKKLPAQRSVEWLADRKFNIGGSEMNVITGDNPYKSERGLIENHLGLAPFTGNINTYWGTVLEDLVVRILKNKWMCKIYELGSLPGVVKLQKFSPDGLTYLEYIDMIVLIEIKNPARRMVNGKIPRTNKPQIYTGLDTIQIADIGMFVDVMFRRCSLDHFDFTPIHDYIVHPNKHVDKPLMLYIISFYTSKGNHTYDDIKELAGFKEDVVIDLGICCITTLTKVLNLAANNFIGVHYSQEFDEDFDKKEAVSMCSHLDGKRVLGILPLKLFKFENVIVERFDWRTNFKRNLKITDNNSFVKNYSSKINEVINTIRELDLLTPDEQMEKLNILYPSNKKAMVLSDDISNYLIDSMK
jgi:hypothetical protein